MKVEPLQLLIAEDEEGHIKSIRRAFYEAGVKVDIHAVGTLREYRERVAAHTPDIAVVDLNLSDGRAVEVLSHPPEDAPFPVLVMTAFGSEQIVVEVMKAGALDYVVKSPEVFADMPHTVERVLREWALRRGRKTMESRQTLAVDILKCLADVDDRDNVIHSILSTAKSATGIEAVAIRLKSGEDFPYYEANGFPDIFVDKESYLCARKEDGSLVRDAQGHAVLECMCGNIISGRTDPRQPFFTKGGSFWANSTTDLLAATTSEQRQAVTRNFCNRSGYESVALIPLRSKARIIGLLQFNDRRKDRFTLDMIEFLEGLGASIGIALERHSAAREKIQLEENFRQSQKMESVGRLAGGVAHDFNNLLTAITCYAGFLLKDMVKGDSRREDVKEILAASDRAAGLTRQLLAFSRKQILSPKIVDLNSSVGGMVKLLKRLIGDDIRLETRLAARSCQIKVDIGQIDQLIVNLAVNARDAMPKGGTLVLETVLVTPCEAFFLKHPEMQRGPLVCLSIRDTGSGITDEVKEHLFEPFFTTKEKGKGTGLGLATVFGIVKQSGGDIEVESEPDEGTVFKIYFPYIEAVIPDKDPDKDKDLNGVITGSETILLVEDEDNLRRLGERLLRMSGYTVIVATGGKEALEAVERHGKPVDLLLTDVVMPGISGRELALELARRKLAHRTLYMSGYTDDAIVRHGVLEPGIAFIYKPFTVESLSLKLREVLDGPADQAKA